MIHPERRRENIKKIEEMDKRDAEPLQSDWKTWCMNKKVDMVEVVRCTDCKWWDKRKYECNNDDVLRRIKDCGCGSTFKTEPDWFCADGKYKENSNEQFRASY